MARFLHFFHAPVSSQDSEFINSLLSPKMQIHRVQGITIRISVINKSVTEVPPVPSMRHDALFPNGSLENGWQVG